VIVNLALPTRRGSGRLFETPEEYAGYRVLDPKGREIGSVKELFVSADDEVKYVEVKTGLLGLQSVLIPVGLVAVDYERRVLLLR
jgi:PRC-barrel domain